MSFGPFSWKCPIKILPRGVYLCRMFRKTRFAPTPSGLLHPGNAISFLLTWTLARYHQAEILLRIDDLDRKRYRQEYVGDIFDTMEWLGLDYDEGPGSVAAFEREWSQVHREPAYIEAVRCLESCARVYACTCTRRDLRRNTLDHRYPGTCRGLMLPLSTSGAAWRLYIPEETAISCLDLSGWPHLLQPALLLGDVVILQKNGSPAYQIASMVDDHHFGIDLIIRGEDLLPSTAVQLHMASLLGWTSLLNAACWHHPLILGEQGLKLSKSKGATSLRSWREAGRSPRELIALAAQFLGLPDTPHNARELLLLYRQAKGV
jgi:glutamyl/glutaminyl-tRNA synthetase